MIPVCIFAKPPLPGTVKTRLIPVLGIAGATELASALLSDAWQTVSACPGIRPVLASTIHADFPVAGPPSQIWLQGDGDLGQRIERILTQALQQAPAAIAVGADTPGLTTSHIACALDALQSHDAVIGPALDGGFYLLALRRLDPGLLSFLPWSMADTCVALKQRLKESRLSIAELEPLFDIDTPADLILLERYLTAHPGSASATRAWFSQSRPRLTPA